MEDGCCSICFHELNHETPETCVNKPKRLLCSHDNKFHDDCIDKWIKKTPNCPICRKHANVINTSNIIINNGRITQYGLGIGPERGFVIYRFINLLSEYSSSINDDEKEHKKMLIYNMMTRHNLVDDERVCSAMSQNNLNITL